MKKLFFVALFIIIVFPIFAEDLEVPLFISIEINDRWAQDLFSEELINILLRSYFVPADSIDSSVIHFIVNAMETKNISNMSIGYAFSFAVIFHGQEAVYYSSVTTGVTGSSESDIKWVAKEGYKYLVNTFEDTVYNMSKY